MQNALTAIVDAISFVMDFGVSFITHLASYIEFVFTSFRYMMDATVFLPPFVLVPAVTALGLYVMRMLLNKDA